MAETTTIALDYGDILSIESGKKPGIRLAQQLEEAKDALAAKIGPKPAPDYADYTPILTNKAALELMTPHQRETFLSKVGSYTNNPDRGHKLERAFIYPDMMGSEPTGMMNVRFEFEDGGSLFGGIEAEGRMHT